MRAKYGKLKLAEMTCLYTPKMLSKYRLRRIYVLHGMIPMFILCAMPFTSTTIAPYNNHARNEPHEHPIQHLFQCILGQHVSTCYEHTRISYTEYKVDRHSIDHSIS